MGKVSLCCQLYFSPYKSWFPLKYPFMLGLILSTGAPDRGGKGCYLCSWWENTRPSGTRTIRRDTGTR